MYAVNNFSIMIVFILYFRIKLFKVVICYPFVKCLPVTCGGWCNVDSFSYGGLITQGHVMWFLSFTGVERIFSKVCVIMCYMLPVLCKCLFIL
jgi:hypothetical protein